MKAPSINSKGNTHRVKRHWSVYVHYASLFFAIFFFILGMGSRLEIITNLNSLLAIMIAITFAGLYKITEPILVPDDTIENQVRFTQKALTYKKSDVSFVLKGLLFCAIWCLVAFLYPLI